MRAIGVTSFSSERLQDLFLHNEIKPAVNQLETNPFFQQQAANAFLQQEGIQHEAWAPFAEGMKGMFSEPVLTEIARRHGKSVPQVILRWNIQRGVSVIPKSVHKERMRENMDVWDFELDGDDMALIGTLDKNRPSMLDPLKPSEVKRLYDYLKNPVLTSLQ